MLSNSQEISIKKWNISDINQLTYLRLSTVFRLFRVSSTTYYQLGLRLRFWNNQYKISNSSFKLNRNNQSKRRDATTKLHFKSINSAINYLTSELSVYYGYAGVNIFILGIRKGLNVVEANVFQDFSIQGKDREVIRSAFPIILQ